MFFKKEKDNVFSELELMRNPQKIKKIKKMELNELRILIDNTIEAGEFIKLKEILNNVQSKHKEALEEHVKKDSLLNKKIKSFIFPNQNNIDTYKESKASTKEINQNTDW